MYFYTICVVALLRVQNLPVSYRNAYRVSRNVYVYGDDILVPTKHAAAVLDYLRLYNCKVNDRKTFFTGKFRESCGVDAYCGKQITPAYINTVVPKNRRQAKELISWVEVANNFFTRGYLTTSNLLFRKVEKILGSLPWVSRFSPALGRHHAWSSSPPKRWNRRYHRLEILLWVRVPIHRTDVVGGYAALQKCLMKLEGLIDLSAPRDKHHLVRTALYGGVAIKRRWVPATSAGQLLAEC
jgi:hypothetical protein